MKKLVSVTFVPKRTWTGGPPTADADYSGRREHEGQLVAVWDDGTVMVADAPADYQFGEDRFELEWLPSTPVPSE
jgi:hypothetical protein